MMIENPIHENEAALELGIPVQTLRRWRTELKGPRYHKIGRSVIYTREFLTEYIDRSVIDPATRKKRKK